MKDKKLRNYIILIVLLIIGLAYVEANKKEPVDWSPTFINTDKNPYGTYICYDLLKDVFPTEKIRMSRYPITNELKYIEKSGSYKNTSYVLISESFDDANNYESQIKVDSLDVKNLLAFVNEGNNVFIAAEKVSPILLDTLKLKIKHEWSSDDLTFVFTDLGNKEYTFRSMNRGQFYITEADSCNLSMRTLAKSKNKDHAVFVKIKYGQGFIYLHSMPVVFSNIELLNTHKYDFAFKCLSYLPKSDNIIWDEYLKQGRVGENSYFRVVWNHPALLMSYAIVLIAGLLLVCFRSKRTQRIIPVVNPPQNTSLEFLDTMSNLYYQKQAYESIIDKRHSYFLDTIRTRYYLRTETIDDEFIMNLTKKSGVAEDVIKDIFALHSNMNNMYNVSNTALLKYSQKLEQFYKEMK